MKYLTNNELSVNTFEEAMAIQKILVNNDYAVMITKEENLYIVNYVWSSLSDRNDVVFRNRSDFIYEEDEEIKEIRKEIEKEYLTK